MSELIKIKQVENLSTELAKIPQIEQLATDASLLAAEAKTGLDAISKGSTRVMQTFKNIVANANAKVNLQLSNPISSDQDVQLFINGVLVHKIIPTIGSDVIEFSVPYSVDINDSVVIYYSI